MQRAEVLASLFPHGYDADREGGLLSGRGTLPDGRPVAFIGVDGRIAVGIDEAAWLARAVLDVIARGEDEAILVLVDSDSQRMSRRDELLGLNEFLAHLAKCLIVADVNGHPTIGLLYGHSAAGAFIATALATRALLALPDAEPEVMDLPSMARVTKLPLALLEARAASTPVFAPGLDNFARTGAVDLTLDPASSLATQVHEVVVRLREARDPVDGRDQRGKDRGGRPKAADIAARVRALVREAGRPGGLGAG